eukprot:1448499-Karenia_brevis.AAC.1
MAIALMLLPILRLRLLNNHLLALIGNMLNQSGGGGATPMSGQGVNSGCEKNERNDTVAQNVDVVERLESAVKKLVPTNPEPAAHGTGDGKSDAE